MKDLTIQDIIKIIPLEQATKDKLLNEYETYDDSLKFEVQKVCWDAFHEYRDGLMKIKYDEYLQEVEDKKRKLTNDLMDQAREAVWQDLMDILAGKREELQQVEHIRTKLQSLIQNPKTP